MTDTGSTALESRFAENVDEVIRLCNALVDAFTDLFDGNLSPAPDMTEDGSEADRR